MDYNFLKEREQAKDKNADDIQWITSYFRYNENNNNSKSFEDIVNKMPEKDIQNMAKKVLDDGKSFQVIFKPK